MGLPDASERDVRRDHRDVLHVVADRAIGHRARQDGVRELGDHTQAYEAPAAAGNPHRVVVEQPQKAVDVLGALGDFELGDPRDERRDVIVSGVGWSVGGTATASSFVSTVGVVWALAMRAFATSTTCHPHSAHSRICGERARRGSLPTRAASRLEDGGTRGGGDRATC